MIKFKFRLQKLLDYRRGLEEAAKTAYLESRARRIDAEYDLQGITQSKTTAVHKGLPCLQNRLALNAYLERLDDQFRAQQSVIAVLEGEEEQLRLAWIRAREEAEALQKLHDKELEAYNLEVTRKEQADLDEWAVLRRAA